MEDKEKIEHEFDPELALAAASAKAEMEARKQESENEEIEIGEEEMVIENEPLEGEGKSILRGKKKKKNNNYNYNNYNERYNYDIGTIDKRITTKSELRNSLLEEKNSNEDISYNPKITNNFRNFKKYKVKCLANSIDERAYKYPFNQFTYKKK